jgi:LmbE family N-acetylglucosaminyl deacetylase
LKRPNRFVVLSPHCDDGVFACGQLLEAHPGSVVITAFAGRQPLGEKLTEWDEAAGFCLGDDVMGFRREEDRAALALLHAKPEWLEFRDSQYKRPPTIEELCSALERALRDSDPDAVCFPLGLFHDDHKLTHMAALRLRQRHKTVSWLAYEDAIYRRYTGLLQERLARLLAEGFVLTPVTSIGPAASALKRRAVACYQSQLRALCTPGRPGYEDVFAPERYWKIE